MRVSILLSVRLCILSSKIGLWKEVAEETFLLDWVAVVLGLFLVLFCFRFYSFVKLKFLATTWA